MFNLLRVDGHARFRVYKFSTTGTTPLMTLTPTTNGADDLFNATIATASETAGSRAFVSATGVFADQVAGPYAMSFTGPNDSAMGWSYDMVAHNPSDFATTDGSTACPSTGCAWVASSGVAMDPGDGNTAWVANQLTSGTSATNWTAVAAAVSGAGTNAPLAPIASAATDITSSGFTANWSPQALAVGYQLDVSTDPGFGSFVSGYQAKDVGNASSFAVTGLSANIKYYYRVRAVGSGTSLDSNTIDVTTSPAAKTAIGPFELLALSLLGLAGLGLRLRRAA